MYIEMLQIGAFGKLSNFTLELKKGVNIIEGANESGKSTLASFIKFIFYGIPAKERSSAASWATGSASGSLILNTAVNDSAADGHRYRIERALTSSGTEKVSYRETVQIIDLSNNMPCHKGECPGELFFGVDADMFAATAFVSQLAGADVGGAKVAEGIENLLFSADETVNTQRALSKLDAARAALRYKNDKGGKLFELENECASLETKLKRALEISQEIQAKEAQLDDVRKNEKAAREKSETLGAKIEQFEARTVVKLFSRMHALDKKADELRAQIDASGAPDPDYVNRVTASLERIRMLRKEIEETSARMNETSEPSPNPKLDEYAERGGREGIESERGSFLATAKFYTAVAVITLILAVGLTAVAIVPLLLHGSPILWALIAAVAELAIAVTMFVLASRQRRKAADLAAEYDVDALDAELESRRTAAEAAKLAVLAREAASRRLMEALDEVSAETENRAKSDTDTDTAAEFDPTAADAEIEALNQKLAALVEKSRAVENLKGEYDKYSSLLSGMKEQLGSYSETDQTAKIDLSVSTDGIDAENLPAIRREAGFAAKSAASLELHATELEKTLAGLYPTTENPAKLSDRLNSAKLERDRLEEKYSAYRLAYDKLSEASENLRGSISPRLAADSAELMKAVTGGKYSELGVGSSLELSALTESGSRGIELLSAGTRDAAYLCLRLALTGILYRKCVPAMIYDESFPRLDDSRLSRMLRIVNTQEQSLVLTSNGRDAELMRGIGEFNYIKL